MTHLEYFENAHFIEEHINKNKISLRGKWILMRVKIHLRNKIAFILLGK